jgi:glucose-6-phosphate isomerase
MSCSRLAPRWLQGPWLAARHRRQRCIGVPKAQQAILLANAIAQAEALMTGSANAAEPHRHFPGDRPSSFILMDRLTPKALGALIALYEHKVFVEGVLWDINSFDQWGVELGKTLATAVLGELQGGEAGAHDASTAALIERLRG